MQRIHDGDAVRPKFVLVTSFDPGWYPDPEAPGGLRWWNGSAWTASRQAPGAIHTFAPPVTVPASASFEHAPAYSINSTRSYYSQASPVVSGPTPLWEPIYGATAGQAFSRFWRKYADFSGRASRSEFWWAYLLVVVLGTVSYVVVMMVALGGASADAGTRSDSGITSAGVVLVFIWFAAYLGMVIPMIAVAVRRLHDAGMSGLFYLVAFVPFGSIVLLLLWLRDSDPMGARFDRPRG